MESTDEWGTTAAPVNREPKEGCCSKVSECIPSWSVKLPQPSRPMYPVSHEKHELLECFPCYFEPTWPLDRLPFLKWLLAYKVNWLLSDVLAGLTVGLMVVPQALAYASIARLPLNYGLYSAFMGCFVYVLFGTSKDITLGPTAILSLLTASITDSCDYDKDQTDLRIPCAIALTFFSGAIQLAIGLLNLGFLVDFIPTPVISGFTSAAALTIALGQVKHVLGITARRDVIFAIYDIFHNIVHTRVWDLVLGVGCITIAVLLKYVKTLVDKYVDNNKGEMKWPLLLACKVLWLICTARNAIVVLLAALLGVGVKHQSWFHGQITFINNTGSSLPPFRVPDITAETCGNLGIGILVAPLISFLESIAISKAFARKSGYKVQPSQELVALGLCNLASSFVGSYPVTGSFSRTAVNAQSGVKTPAAGIITGTIVLLALALLGPAFNYIPSTALAAIIIAAVVPVVDVVIVWKIIRLKWTDIIPFVASFFFTLFLGIEYGVPIAVVIYIVFLLYRHARPRHEVRVLGKMVIISMNGGWTYPGVNYILKRVLTEVTTIDDCSNRERTEVLVVDCSSMPEIDYTIVQEFSETCDELHKLQIKVCIVAAQDQVHVILQKANIKHLYFCNSMAEVSGVIGNLRNDASYTVQEATTST